MKAALVRHPILSIIVAGFLLGPTIGAQAPAFKDLRRFYIEGYDKAIGDDRRVDDCFMTKLKERGSFTFESSKEAAEAIIMIDTTVPSGSSRVLWGKSPSVRMTVATLDGRILWKGENKYKKGITVWGGGTDLQCGLANGIADKLVKAMQGK
jgi:hypothetical protein